MSQLLANRTPTSERYDPGPASSCTRTPLPQEAQDDIFHTLRDFRALLIPGGIGIAPGVLAEIPIDSVET